MKRSVLCVLLMAVAVSGCYGKALPNNNAAPAGCTPTKILFVGDSLLAQARQAIVDEFRANGYGDENDIQVVAHGGSNVNEYAWWLDAPAGFANPLEELQEHLDTFQPDVVVAEWGINRVDSLWGSVPELLLPWVLANDMHAVQAMVEATPNHAKLYWTTIPVRDNVDDPALNDFVNGVVNDELIANLGVPLVDWRSAVAPEDGDAYAEFLKFHEDEAVHPVRESDGIHLAPDGVARVARQTLHDLAPVACQQTNPSDSSPDTSADTSSGT